MKIRKLKVVRILAEDFPGDGSDGGNVYDKRWHDDSRAYGGLRVEVEDEAEQFLVDVESGDIWLTDDFFKEEDVESIICTMS
jgi:hypothetical protein